MTTKKFSNALGNIGESYVDEAATYTAKKKSNAWLKWGAIAACFCLVVGVVFRIAIGFFPSQMTDIYREGTLIEITNESELPAQYEGKLLAFNLGFEQYEFYYKTDGNAENTDDWLIYGKQTRKKRVYIKQMPAKMAGIFYAGSMTVQLNKK